MFETKMDGQKVRVNNFRMIEIDEGKTKGYCFMFPVSCFLSLQIHTRDGPMHTCIFKMTAADDIVWTRNKIRIFGYLPV